MGAWIEIEKILYLFLCLQSLPSWERGLKLEELCMLNTMTTSLPSWERGLKLYEEIGERLYQQVAPLVGAWIEIDAYDLWTGE